MLVTVLGFGLGSAASADVLPVSFESALHADATLAPDPSIRPRRIEVGGGPDPGSLALLTAGLVGLGLLGKPQARTARQGAS